MTTLPIHTVQHVKSMYNKYQVIAVVFTAATLLADQYGAIVVDIWKQTSPVQRKFQSV